MLAAVPKQSAGLLMYRHRGALEVLLVHPGGPFWRDRDAGAWTLPKGEFTDGESALDAACREFVEETGVTPEGPFLALTPVRQKAGKLVHAWAFRGDCDLSKLTSNSFTMEWPPRSGKLASYPEVDRAEFFTIAAAQSKINPAQLALLAELGRLLT